LLWIKDSMERSGDPWRSAAAPVPPSKGTTSVSVHSGGIPRYRQFDGPILFQAGFRPFFLGAGLWAVLTLVFWIFFLFGHMASPNPTDPLLWHMHEMLFGFGVAAMAGFLLTAVPNWTGRLPLQGWPLMLLWLLWAAGRAIGLLPTLSGTIIGSAVDLGFLAALLAAIAREIVAGRNWRNLPMVAAVALLLAANALMQAQAVGLAETAMLGVRLGLAVLLTMIALVGGRIIPSFTRNWLAKRGDARVPAAFGIVDRIALAATIGGLAAWVAALPALIVGPLLILAGVAAAFRLARWRGTLTCSEPLLLVLHVGHGWLALGLAMLGLSELWHGLPPSSALHALTIGAIGTMTLAVMTRATLGHTGRELTAGAGTMAIFILINLAAIARIAAGLVGGGYMPLLALAGTAWIGAFALFVLLYGPLLMRPRASN
jgi:uncharacterized protein involved in response to NO